MSSDDHVPTRAPPTQQQLLSGTTYTFTIVGEYIYITIPIIDNLHHDGKLIFFFLELQVTVA